MKQNISEQTEVIRDVCYLFENVRVIENSVKEDFVPVVVTRENGSRRAFFAQNFPLHGEDVIDRVKYSFYHMLEEVNNYYEHKGKDISGTIDRIRSIYFAPDDVEVRVAAMRELVDELQSANKDNVREKEEESEM